LSRARSLYQIGEVRLGEGRAAEAESALQESLRLVQALSDRAPDDLERLFELSQAQFWVGYAAYLDKDFDTAEEYLLGYRESTERLVTAVPENATYRLEAGFAYSNLGSVRERKGDLEGAAEAYGRTIENTRALVNEFPDSVEWLGNLSESHNTLGVVYRKLGRYQESLREHVEELELKNQVLERVPGHAFWRFRRAMAHVFIGRVEVILGQVDAASSSYLTAATALDSMVVLDPSNALWRREDANAYSSVGQVLAMAGRLEEASRAFSTARDRLAPVLAADSTSFDYGAMLGSIEASRARSLESYLEPDQVLAITQEAERLMSGAPEGDLEIERSAIRNALTRARALEAMGRGQEALSIREEALTRAGALVESLGIEGRAVFAEAYLALGRRDDAAGVLQSLWRLGYRDPLLVQLAGAYDVGP